MSVRRQALVLLAALMGGMCWRPVQGADCIAQLPESTRAANPAELSPAAQLAEPARAPHALESLRAGGAAQSPPADADPLAAGFRQPPDDARPWVYWLWLGGYVNRDHVAAELRELHKAGIRGVCLFDMGARGPVEAQPPAGPAFLSDPWLDNLAAAVQAASELGIEVELAVCSSWDMGGAWVQPAQASKGLYIAEFELTGPQEFNAVLPLPPLPQPPPEARPWAAAAAPDSAADPRSGGARPPGVQDVAVLALCAEQRLPGHDFVFSLDPPLPRRLVRAVLYNTPSEDPAKHGPQQLFARDFSLAVSTTEPTAAAFQEVLRGTLRPAPGGQEFPLPPVAARYVRLRILSSYNPAFERVELGEFELYDEGGANVVASHEAQRTREGARLLSYTSALGHDRDWTAANIHDGQKSGPAGSWSSAGLPPLLLAGPEAIVDLTDRVGADGRLKWQVPPGRWLVERFVCAPTWERLKVPSPQSDGLVTDHFDGHATRAFIEYVISRLQGRLGKLCGSALTHLYLPSYEVRGRLWTPELPAQFARLRHYELKPFLPALAGHVVQSPEATERFLYDYRKTQGDLLVEAYYQPAVAAAHAAGLKIEAEAGGPGPPIHQVPVDALKALGSIDTMRGEFWPHRPDAHALWVVKETACAAHIYGRRQVRMEAFTSMHHWQDGPFDLKPAADRAFCEGMNHVVWHTGAHLPPEAGKPGWVYHAGTHLNPNLIWWPQAGAFLDYLARCSFLLQQGLFVADVCYYYGDQGYNFVPPKHVHPSLGYGYDYDVVNREVILTRMFVRDGRLWLPDGMSYALLVLPDRPDIDLEVLEKIAELVAHGATVVGPKPVRATGLGDFRRRDAEVRSLAERVWGPCDGQQQREHRFGQGRVIWGRTLREVLQEKGIGPDFAVSPLPAQPGGAAPPQAARQTQPGSGSPQPGTADALAAIDFVHRRTPEADIYFVRNCTPEWTNLRATFRVPDGCPEMWDPASGSIRPQHVFEPTPSGVRVPLQLAPYGSTFVVFRQAGRRLPPIVLQEPPPASGPFSAQVTAWDGQRAVLSVFRPGLYRLRTADGREARRLVNDLPRPIALAGPWEVEFAPALGTPQQVRFAELRPWNEYPDPSVRYFSGIARYRCRFHLADDWLAEDRRLWLDLGGLWAVGEAWLNGQPLGAIWYPPFAVEVTAAAKPGHNELVVAVANTWSNCLVGEARGQTPRQLTRTNVRSSNGLPWKDVPLIDAGLFGPVRIVPGNVIALEPRGPE